MRRIARVDYLVPVAVAVIVVLVLLTRRATPCSAAEPCGPDAARWIAFGALVAPALMVQVHRTAAAVVACCCALLWLATFAGWLVLTAWAYAALTVWVARRRTEPAAAPTARRRPAPPRTLPAVARPELLIAVALFAVTAGLGGWVSWRQDGVDRQQAEARIVTGVVLERLGGDDPGLLVATAGGDRVRVASLTPPDYPVGGSVQVAVDDRGLRQLRSEPYDLTPWLALVVALAGLGVALLARVWQRRRDLRLFFATPQPVRAVRVVDDVGYVHVLVPAADHRTAVEFGIDVADAGTPPPERDDDAEPVTMPATLYGEPRPGRWCAVEVAGRLRVPTAPVGGTEEVGYDPAHAVPQEVTDDDEQIVDPSRLTAYDRDAPPDEVHEHRISPVRAWLDTALIGLGAACTLAEVLNVVGHANGWPLVTAVAAGSAAGYEFGWRARIRPRLRWDVGGVASVGFRRRERQPWTLDSAALADGSGGVTLIAGDAVLTVDAPPPWPPWAAQRTADELVAALRHAHHRALGADHAPPPPEISLTGRPPAWYAVWAATVAVAAMLAW